MEGHREPTFHLHPRELEKMRKQYEAEKEELIRQIGQLTIEVN
ncbi:hypothetical protein [Moorella sulfitireducens (nom. illeg.)]|nr:hypothetical protein [Moorella sulfitireducens]